MRCTQVNIVSESTFEACWLRLSTNMASLVSYARYWFTDRLVSIKVMIFKMVEMVEKGFVRPLGPSSTTMSDSHVPIPYYIDPDLLPAPLPTNAEIENSTDEIGDSQDRCVVFLGPYFVVKYGIMINLMECQNMLFVKQKSKIRVPQVYAMYTDTETGKNYIVMEYIEGQTLEKAWPNLESLDKEQISTILRYYLDELHAMPPSGYYGSLGKLHYLNGIF